MKIKYYYILFLMAVTLYFSPDMTQFLGGDLSTMTSMGGGIRLQVLNGNFNLPLNNIRDGSYMFYGSISLTSFNSDLPNLSIGDSMLTECSNLETFNSDLPNLTDGSSMFYNTKLKTFNIDLLKLTNGSNMFYDCTNLETFNSDLPNLTEGIYMFYNCKLPADNINKILTSLPIVTGSHIITFSECPGASTCDTSIGTKKGWTVQI